MPAKPAIAPRSALARHVLYTTLRDRTVTERPFARWVIVVPRAERELYDRLRERLGGDASFRVLLERRQGDRRRAASDGRSGDRRRSDRRQQRPVGLVYLAAVSCPDVIFDLPAPATAANRGPTLITAACPACAAMLSFELPRFPKPPARLDAEVLHVGGVGTPLHYAEIQAFTVSGRPLLIGRIQALRPTSSS
jgi:hypothetical protein